MLPDSHDALLGEKEVRVNIDSLNYLFGEINIPLVELRRPVVYVHKVQDGTLQLIQPFKQDNNTTTDTSNSISIPALLIQRLAIRRLDFICLTHFL